MLKLIICFLLFFIFIIFIHYNQPNNYNRVFISNYYKNQTESSSLTEIPLVVINTLKEYEINEFFFQEVIHPKIKMNPEFTFHFYDNNSIDIFLLQYFPTDVYNSYKKINPKFGACLSDFARYCLLYIYGGVYMDIKSDIKTNLYPLLKKYNRKNTLLVSHWECTKNNLSKAVNLHSEILPFERGEIQNWVFVVTPKHPVLKLVIQEMIRLLDYGKNGKTKRFVLELTGPIMFSRVIHRCLQDENLKNQIVITDELHDYFNYTKKTIECLGDCKKWFYDKMTHYSNVGENVIMDFSP